MSEGRHVRADRAVVERYLSDQQDRPADLSRRKLLVSAGAFVAAGPAASQSLARAATVSRAAGVPTNEQMAARFRPTFAKDVGRLVDLNSTNQGGAYWNYRTFITPVSDFFIRNEYPTPRAETDPRVDPRHWRLKVHGDGIARELELSYDDLLAMPSRTLVSVMECAGNGRSLFWEQQGMTETPTAVGGTGWGLGGIGQAEWEYVPIGEILDRAGLKREAVSALFWSGVDAKTPGQPGDIGRPVPVSLLRENAGNIGLAYKMNGLPLTADHGAPVRAFVPGWCGAASIKWLSEIKIATHDFWVPLNSFRHVLIGPGYPVPRPAPSDEMRFVTPGRIRGPMVTWLPAKSLITVPLVLEKQPKIPHNYPLAPGQLPRLVQGPQAVRGYAWAPRAGVQKVEYRINAGSWQRARIIDPPMSRFAWVRFDFLWAPTPGFYTVETRVTDREGRSQPLVVAYNEGGFDFDAVPKFHIEVVA